MTKLEEIKQEIKLCGDGILYIDKYSGKRHLGNNLNDEQKAINEVCDQKINEFLPKLGEKMKHVCRLVADLEKETGRKFDWDNPDLFYDLGDQLDFTKELMK